jgi:membrane-associated phospholipid phosphatase
MLAAYLAATLLPAMLAARSGAGGPLLVLVAHGATLTLLMLLLRRVDGGVSPVRRWTIMLAPLIAIPLLYAELPTLMAGLRDGYLDAIVQPWEYAMFGGDTPARTLAPAIHRTMGAGAGTALSELLFASYLSYYLIIYVPPILLLLRKQYEIYNLTLAGMMAAFLVCYLAFVVFPVEGPRYIWPAPDGDMHGPIRALTLRVVEAGSSRGAEFPSSHVAVAVAQSVMAWRWQPGIGRVMAVATVLLSVAVIFAGFHYAVDVLAGAVVGAAIGSAATRFGATRIPR